MARPAVTLHLLLSINDGPPIEIGTGEVYVGDTRATWPRCCARRPTRSTTAQRSARATCSGSARRTRGAGVRFHLSLTIETGPTPPEPEAPRESSIETLVENRVGFTAASPLDVER
jgi:hypothetical protein